MTRGEKARQLLETLKAAGGRVLVRNGTVQFTAPPGSVDARFIRETLAWKWEIENQVLEDLLGRGQRACERQGPLPVFDRRDVEAAVRDDIEPLFPDGVPGSEQ